MNRVIDNEASVVSVNRADAKGEAKTPYPDIVLDAQGVVDDAHRGDWHRQVSLLAVESIDRFSQAKERPFAYGDFAENITTRGVDLLRTTPLDRFTIGAVELEVTQLGKKCHGGGCAIFREVGQCVMPTDGIFCRVLEGGTLRAGDTIAYAPKVLRCQVITLSDRAHGGIYADRSGPRIGYHLQEYAKESRWGVETETTLLQDGTGPLEHALQDAREAAVDVVFTTGGTGIGPRDFTPDVVNAMADRVIPGIMEHIRVKYGAEIPNALLSRSVAAVLGRTLVYTLPGSIKAVDEYMAEILKTLEHAICMVHGLDAH